MFTQRFQGNPQDDGELTPAIEPLSLDEAFLDLRGTEKLHGHPPAVMLARLVKRMRDELGIGGSIGLSHITNFWQKSPRIWTNPKALL